MNSWPTMWPSSLTLRLAISAGLWIGGALLATAVLLMLLFRGHIERRFDALLYDHLEELVAASEIDLGGLLSLSWIPADPRFHRPHSGWYWQIQQGQRVLRRSVSLWRERLNSTPAISAATYHLEPLTGPGGQPLRALVQPITLPESEAVFTFTIAGPADDIDQDVHTFTTSLALSLTVLASGLLVAVLVQVRVGLRPLRALRATLSQIRSGMHQRLPVDYPAELQPLATELNTLLDHNEMLLQRARSQASDLSHALKNPLTVISNEAQLLENEQGRILREQVNAMRNAIGRYLSRARTAGMAHVVGTRTVVAGVATDMIATLSRLYPECKLDLRTEELTGLYFRGDPQDLEEILGNLLDNACKWAQCQVRLSGEQRGLQLYLTVEDDGPGIPVEHRANVLQRGQRLDEMVTGSGLGLAIVADIIELYQGTLTLGDSSLGGLKITIVLPGYASDHL